MTNSANILITGGSGYLGGNVLAQLPEANLPSHGTVYALVRSEEQASAVRAMGFSPLQFDVNDAATVEKAITQNEISVVFWLIDALSFKSQSYFINALSKVKVQMGREVHFLHTSGAKLFSSHAGAPTDQPLFDDDPNLLQIQKNQHAGVELIQNAVSANNSVVEEAESLGVRSYIFAPCIVYGKGKGFGNPISIQTVSIINAAKASGSVFSVDKGSPTWPVCHISDTASLYLKILQKILQEENIGYGKDGYYVAASGSVVWDDLYSAMAMALYRRGIVESPKVAMADDEALSKMAEALRCPKEFVPIHVGGRCTLTARHGGKIGWEPKFGPEHILEDADAECALVLKHI